MKKNYNSILHLPPRTCIQKTATSFICIGPFGETFLEKNHFDTSGYSLVDKKKNQLFFRSLRVYKSSGVFDSPQLSAKLSTPSFGALEKPKKFYSPFKKKNSSPKEKKFSPVFIFQKNNLFSHLPVGGKKKSYSKGEGDPGRPHFIENGLSFNTFLSTLLSSCNTSRLYAKLHGISSGYAIFLKLQGLGYRFSTFFKKKKTILSIKVGCSHKIKWYLPSTLLLFTFPRNKICLFAIEKKHLHDSVFKIRQIQPPSRYKGKGIHYLHENFKVKEGKKNK